MWCSAVNPASFIWSAKAALCCMLGVDLPGDRHDLLAGRCQVRHADEVPLGIRPHVHKLRLRIGSEGFPDLRGGHILDHGRNSGCMRIAMTQLYHGTRWQEDLAASIGSTPLIRLRGASEATGCTILGKAEFMNPGGSVKDRTGLYIIADAEKRGALKPGGTIVEGTAGNTGIGLTLVGNARGYRCVIVMPETQSREKIDFLRMIGADLRLVPAKPYRDPGNYVHVSRRMAEETGAVWANQFDNLANREGHRLGTGRGDLGADRGQGGRLHLRLRHRRHAGRRRHGAEAAESEGPGRAGRPGGQRALRAG